MTRINIPDLAFALFLVALGTLAYVLSSDLPMGRAGAMGPGYVPRALALMLGVYGLVLGARALIAKAEPMPAVVWRPLILIALAVALFAVLLPVAGLVITSAVVVFCAGFAAADVQPLENAVLAAMLAGFAVALFVLALGLPLPVWPP